MQDVSPNSSSVKVAIWDFVEGFANWRLWAFLGLQDIKQRYRRSSFGPLWLALGLGVTIIGIGILYSQILKVDAGVFIPFIAISLLIWNFVSTVINESTTIFQMGSGLITSVKVPYTSFVLRSLIRNLIVAAHCAVPVVLAYAFLKYPVHLVALASFAGLLVLLANMYWISLLVGIVCLRFRDIGQMVIYAVQLALFLTPIIWMPSQIRPGSAYMQFNPAYHLINIIRTPIFYGKIPTDSFAVSLCMLVVGGVLTAITLARSRRYIVFWI